MSSPWIMRSQTDMNTNREVWYNQGQQDETVRGRIQCELKERPNGTQNHNKCGLLICHLRHGTNASTSSQRLQRKRKGSINTPKRNYDLFYKYTESIIQLIMFIRYAGSVAVWIRIRWLWIILLLMLLILKWSNRVESGCYLSVFAFTEPIHTANTLPSLKSKTNGWKNQPGRHIVQWRVSVNNF